MGENLEKVEGRGYIILGCIEYLQPHTRQIIRDIGMWLQIDIISI